MWNQGWSTCGPQRHLYEEGYMHWCILYRKWQKLHQSVQCCLWKWGVCAFLYTGDTAWLTWGLAVRGVLQCAHNKHSHWNCRGGWYQNRYVSRRWAGQSIAHKILCVLVAACHEPKNIDCVVLEQRSWLNWTALSLKVGRTSRLESFYPQSQLSASTNIQVCTGRPLSWEPQQRSIPLPS